MLLQGSGVTQLRLALSFQAIEAITTGAELVFEVDDLQVHIRCDDEAYEIFQKHMQRVLLEMVPTDGTVH